jgi:glycosyltransferase involved in cell wall biosynthesis
MNTSFFWRHFGDGPERSEIENYANQKLKKGTFKFMGFVTNSLLLEYYKNNPVDVFINMSELEGIPVSMMEAISAGIPLVGCDVCGVPEIVTEQTGLLLPKEIVPTTAAKNIETFLIEKSRDLGFRKQVVQFWSENYSAEVNYRSFVNQLQSE